MALRQSKRNHLPPVHQQKAYPVWCTIHTYVSRCSYIAVLQQQASFRLEVTDILWAGDHQNMPVTSRRHEMSVKTSL